MCITLKRALISLLLCHQLSSALNAVRAGTTGKEKKGKRQDLIANEFNLGEQQNLQFVLISLAKLEGMQGARELSSLHITLHLS